MHVTFNRSHHVYRAGTTADLPDTDARILIDQGIARERRIDAPAKNASRDDWADYAGKLNVTITDDMGRDDIITATEPPGGTP